MIIVKGGVTTPDGFLANGVTAGMKKSGKPDLALLYSQVPAVAAAAFTSNAFQASPIKVSKEHIKNKAHWAIIVNSGNANCANGKKGDNDALLMADYIARAMNIDRKEVLVASTGVIGKDLPIKKIKDNVGELVGGLSQKNAKLFAEAILTTDTGKKEFAVKLKLGKSIVTIGGACKGVGMIYPALALQRHATMLCFITTDVSISKKMLEESLSEAVGESFNMVSVDGDMSTNDACFILANGLVGNKEIVAKDKGYRDFTDSLKFLTGELAKMIVRDGEGATKFIEIKVTGGKTKCDAAKIARKVSTSNLLKCCIYGEDPNWGRIMAACGSSGVDFNADAVDVYIGGIKVVSGGGRVKDYDKKKAKKIFEKDDIDIEVRLNNGNACATAWTCDLSKKYVEINSEYST